MSYAITPSTRGVKIRPTVLGKLVWGSHRQSVVKKKKKSTCQCRRRKRLRFDSWRGKWQPTPIFFPGEAHGQRSLAGCSPWGHKSRTWPSTARHWGRQDKKQGPHFVTLHQAVIHNLHFFVSCLSFIPALFPAFTKWYFSLKSILAHILSGKR